jgi:hypothetical protein
MEPAANVRASLIPVPAFVVAAAVADPSLPWGRSLVAFVLLSPLIAGFVAVPTWLALGYARRRWVAWSVVATMTTVGAATAATMVRSPDAQAGLVVLALPCVGFVLAILVIAGEQLV